MVFRKTLKPKKSKGFMLVHSRARPSIHYFNGNTLATRMRAWHFSLCHPTLRCLCSASALARLLSLSLWTRRCHGTQQVLFALKQRNSACCYSVCLIRLSPFFAGLPKGRRNKTTEYPVRNEIATSRKILFLCENNRCNVLYTLLLHDGMRLSGKRKNSWQNHHYLASFCLQSCPTATRFLECICIHSWM